MHSPAHPGHRSGHHYLGCGTGLDPSASRHELIFLAFLNTSRVLIPWRGAHHLVLHVHSLSHVTQRCGSVQLIQTSQCPHVHSPSFVTPAYSHSSYHVTFRGRRCRCCSCLCCLGVVSAPKGKQDIVGFRHLASNSHLVTNLWQPPALP